MSTIVPEETVLQSVDALPEPRTRIGATALLAGSKQRMRSASVAGV